MAFHERVYEGYVEIANKEPNRVVKVNGRQTPEQIFADVLSALKERGIL